MKPTFKRAGLGFFGAALLVAVPIAIAAATKPEPLTVHEARVRYELARGDARKSPEQLRWFIKTEYELQLAINRERERCERE